MSRSAASSWSLENSGGEPLSVSCPASFTALFLGAAMAIPGERVNRPLSIPTQTPVKGLLDAPKALLCRSATRHEILEIDLLSFWNPTAGSDCSSAPDRAG